MTTKSYRGYTSRQIYSPDFWTRTAPPVAPPPEEKEPLPVIVFTQEDLDRINSEMWTEIEAAHPGCLVPKSVVAYWAAHGRKYPHSY